MEIVLLVVLLVLVVALFVLSYVKKKKFNTELGAMREELKPGDKVMTDTGVVGEVVESFTEDEYKYFVLKTGRGEHTGYFTVHANAIYYIFGKDEPATKKVVVVKKPNAEQVKEAPKAEEKPVEKPVEEKEVKEEVKPEAKKVEKAEKPAQPKANSNKKSK